MIHLKSYGVVMEYASSPRANGICDRAQRSAIGVHTFRMLLDGTFLFFWDIMAEYGGN